MGNDGVRTLRILSHHTDRHNTFRQSELAVSIPNPAPLRRPRNYDDGRQKAIEDRPRQRREDDDRLRQRRDDDDRPRQRRDDDDCLRQRRDDDDRPRQRRDDDDRARPQKRDDDSATRVSDGNRSNDRFGKSSGPGRPYQKKDSGAGGNNQNFSPRNQTQFPNKNLRRPRPAEQAPEEPVADTKPETKPVVKEEPQPAKEVETTPVTVPSVRTTPQVNGIPKPETPAAKPATLGDVTPTKKLVPKNYLIDLLSIGETVVLSVDGKASDLRSLRGDYVCVCLNDRFEGDYQTLCGDYLEECDADTEQHKLIPGEACSYFIEAEASWYRARCLNANTLALLDCSKIVNIQATDKIRKLAAKYELIPEFCCVIEASNLKVGESLRCTIVSKTGDGYKVTLADVESGTSVGEGMVYRWVPTVDYPTKAVIPEVPRPDLKSSSRVLLVDATSLDRAFVRPAEPELQRLYDEVLQDVLLAGMKASPLKEPPQRGSTVIAKFTDGLHYRAFCKRVHPIQTKYLLEYIDFGNQEVCQNLDNLFPCPPNLVLSAIPTQVSMIKLSAEPGELTKDATEYIEKLKEGCDELILTLPDGETSAPSGAQASLKLVKTGEPVTKKIIEMCTPEWKKLQAGGGDVVEAPTLMFSDLEYRDLPAGPCELDILDTSLLQSGVLSGCVRGDKHVDFVCNQLTTKIAEYCNSDLGREPYLPKIEELCIAQCPPYPQWFRAAMTEQIKGAGGPTARVCYLDYGNVDVVSVSLLRKMLPEFVNGIPVAASHLEIADFPEDPTPEMLLRALKYLELDDEGRGKLRVKNCIKTDPGMYTIQAPDLIQAMTAK